MEHSKDERGVSQDEHGVHTCPICKGKFTILNVGEYSWSRQYRKEKWFFCSRSCYLKFNAHIDEERKKAYEARIAENQVKRSVVVKKASEVSGDIKVILWTPWIARKLGIDE